MERTEKEDSRAGGVRGNVPGGVLQKEHLRHPVFSAIDINEILIYGGYGANTRRSKLDSGSGFSLKSQPRDDLAGGHI